MVCPSEPRTVELLRDQARRMHAAWGAKGYMMSHDEIRVLNWCAACERRQLDAGAILADNARTCLQILREVNPKGRIYVWSDMFDPNHNAHKDYYLVRGDLAGSWEGLDREVIIVTWAFQQARGELAVLCRARPSPDHCRLLRQQRRANSRLAEHRQTVSRHCGRDGH